MATPSRLQEPERYGRVVANLAGLTALLVAIGVAQFHQTRPRVEPTPTPALAVVPSPPPPPLAASKPPPTMPRPTAPAPAPVPPPPILDRDAIARAEADVEAATREKTRAEARLAEAEMDATAAAAKVSNRVMAARDLPNRLRDPSSRIARASSRLKSLQDEKSRIEKDLAKLEKTPRPKGKPLIDKSPVARPANGEEFHFELRNQRVTPIDLERLLAQVKVDARIQLRRSEGRAAALNGHVGPIGAFGMTYQLGRTGDPYDVVGASFGLQAWEIIPEIDLRGETFETAVRPISNFSRSMARLNRERATVTLWTYADSFDLYRKLRDHLHSQGYQVAARPMPEGMPIRGSLAGTVSAGQ